MARQNLLSNPGFSANTAGWSPLQGATLAHVDPPTADRACMRVTKTILAGNGATTGYYIPVTASLPYSMSGYFFVPQGEDAGRFAVSITWFNYNSGTDTYTLLSTSEATSVLVSPGDPFTRVTQLATAPATATHAKFSAYQTTVSNVNKYFYVDSVLMEQSEYVGSFINVLSQAEESETVNRALSAYHDLNHITGLQLNADVQLGDFVLNTIDESDTVWICTDIDGWWNTAEPVLPDVNRGFEDGSYDVSGRYASRSLTLTGIFIPQSPSGVGAARASLLEAIDLVRKGAWLRTSEEPTRASFVRLAGRPTFLTTNPRGRTEFVVPLRAGDPVKYKWDDTKVDGIASETIDLATTGGLEYDEITLTNEGNAPVTTTLVFTGPLGAGSTVDVYHVGTDTSQTLTVIEPLRGQGAVATITFVEMTDNVVTITTLEPHNLSVGEVVAVSGTTKNLVHGEQWVVTAVTDQLPYTLSYERPDSNNDIPKEGSAGTVSLVAADEMIVDTYNRNVTLNGDDTGHRSKLDTLTDWVYLEPGANEVTFTDSIDTVAVSNKQFDPVTGNAVLTTELSHFNKVNDHVTVALPTAAVIAYKAQAATTATITTKNSHGFSEKDQVTVTTAVSTDIVNKELTSGTVTLELASADGLSVGDQITVALATSRPVVSKTRVGDQVILTTTTAHGFSTGDKVTVTFPTDGYAAKKAFANDVATITTQATHNFSIGDVIMVDLPDTTTVTGKTLSGNSATLTTAAAHDFLVNDKITVALPATATLTSTRSFGGSGFAAVTNNAASTTQCTLTAVGHGFAVGDTIRVTGMDARFNVASALVHASSTADTIVYDKAGAVVTSVESVGNVVNLTTSYQVKLTTSSAHGYVAGDEVAVNIGIADSQTVTNRAATTGACTLTLTNTHNYAVGEVIVVAGVDARFDGTFSITGVHVGDKTVTYANAGAAVSPAVVSSGTVVNNTIRNGYNGAKIVYAVPSATTLTYLYYAQDGATVNTNAAVTTASLANVTNAALNGTVTLTNVTGTTMTYTKGA
jgi:hypothetical protein